MNLLLRRNGLHFFVGRYDDTLPKFRYTGTAPSGNFHPVILDTEEINVDVIMNGGVFLCVKPGYYQFTAALGSRTSDTDIALWILHNSRQKVYAR